MRMTTTTDAQPASTAPRHAELTLGTEHFRESNEQVRAALAVADVLTINEVHAQRYLGCAMPAGKRLEIHGTPGNDLACYMDGGSVEVFGNAQDQVGNTMNRGTVVIHGRCGDATGYGMRGGSIFIRDDCGWRVGVHMKEYQEHRPVIFIGGNAGNFLGEYQAGGIIVLLGNAGAYLATGMHGGVIYLAHRLDERDVRAGLVQSRVDEDDLAVLQPLLSEYARLFAGERKLPDIPAADFYRLRPENSRPYGSAYVG